jgi:hypothetical protein
MDRGSAEDFIQQAFSPVVVVLVSEDAEKACQKSNLDFIQLLSPFNRFKGSGYMRFVVVPF